jgi:hypothetical protein
VHPLAITGAKNERPCAWPCCVAPATSKTGCNGRLFDLPERQTHCSAGQRPANVHPKTNTQAEGLPQTFVPAIKTDLWQPYRLQIIFFPDVPGRRPPSSGCALGYYGTGLQPASPQSNAEAMPDQPFQQMVSSSRASIPCAADGKAEGSETTPRTGIGTVLPRKNGCLATWYRHSSRSSGKERQEGGMTWVQHTPRWGEKPRPASRPAFQQSSLPGMLGVYNL